MSGKDRSVARAGVGFTGEGRASLTETPMLYVLFLYASLGDESFASRESATVSLSHLIDRHPATYGPRLGEWASQAACPEVRARCRRILAHYTRWRVNSYVPPTPCFPICDCFPVACPVVPFGLVDVRDRCRWPVASRPDDARGPIWTGYRRTTEARVREMLRQGVSEAEVSDILTRMWMLEVRDRHDCGVTISGQSR
jgi:hypothetical protein